uniref:clostripain-related cysteine peptidase n=1 Tax=Parapedobacter pyrenivorans TaxID=1305674 RepID=UPI0033420858
MDNRPSNGYIAASKFVLMAFLVLSMLGCSKNDEVGPDLPNRTILYYLGADNNLHVEADEKIEALRLGFPGGDNRLVIYKDIPNSVPQLLEIYADKTGENQIRIIKGYPEQNEVVAGDIQLLLDDIQQLFPAKSYGLILFSHASGWLPQGTLTRPETALLRMGRFPIRTYTIAMDGTSELGLKEFAAAIPDHFFDFIAFEACFMAGIEVLYELKDKTDYILSSSAEVVSPGFAPVYP